MYKLNEEKTASHDFFHKFIQNQTVLMAAWQVWESIGIIILCENSFFMQKEHT